MKEANVDVRTVRKWVAKDAVEDAESKLRHTDIVGRGNIWKAWFWQYPTTIVGVS